MELLHDRPALGLMEEQTLLGRKVPLFGDRVVVVHRRDRLQYVLALLGKPIRHLDELPPPMRHIPSSAYGALTAKVRLPSGEIVDQYDKPYTLRKLLPGFIIPAAPR